MTAMYEKLSMPAEGLRLHLNENTGGCSQAVLDALGALTREMAAVYPDYTDATAATATLLGVPPSYVVLVNGLDEGIFAAALATLRGPSPSPLESVIVVPAFDMYAGSSRKAGGKVVEVPLAPGFAFGADDVVAAVTAATRIVFLTTPHNPTGLLIPRASVLSIAGAAPQALIFVDEAYIDFGGETLIEQSLLDRYPNLVVGRTFSKAYGLAALRAGALVATPATLGRIRECVPPYSINIAAALAVPAAMRDTTHYDWYLNEVRESKRLLYAALDRLGLTYLRSEANFVFAHFGDAAEDVVTGLKARGIYVRDRSGDPLCTGYVRITTGVVIHTQACIAAVEEVLCGGR
ncbi:MAG: histidinol-phosphate aminotransferase family protein [Acidobacteria bacterium]|nr:histidinol-phosphate aminotransferase family protein [Acidobacteriota bacterium]